MEQQPLFPAQNTAAEASARSDDEAAAHIAEHAKTVEHPDRTSEAARDQGWGPVDVPVRPEAPQRRGSRKAPKPAGPVQGDSELDTGQPGYHETYVPDEPSEAELSGLRLGMTATREALNRDNSS